MFKNNFLISFGSSVILGFLVWWLSLSFTGAVEPWDAENGYYFIALGIVGVVGGFLGGKRFWLWPLAIIVGQIIAIIIMHFTHPPAGVDFFIPLGLIFLIICSVPSFVGSAIGVGLSRMILKHIGQNQNQRTSR